MKQNLPFHILLVLAVATTGLAVFYNMVLRQDYGVQVMLQLPDPGSPPAVSEQEHQTPSQYGNAPEALYQYDDYYAQPHEAVPLVQFPLELNTVAVDELMFVPQIGSVTAQRIVQYRQQLGGYTDLAQLMEIQGIGEKTYATIEPYLYLEGQWSQEEENGANEE